MTRLTIFVVAAAMALSTAAARAQDYYAGASARVGGQFGDGVGGGLAGFVGAAFKSFRIEGEIARTDVGAILGGGDTSSTSFMANGYYDFNTGTALKPYIGAGIGVARVKFEQQFLDMTIAENTETVFAYQLMAGLSYAIRPASAIFGGYRYFGTGEVTATSSAGSFDQSVSFHAVELGIRFGF